jgi:hypothetical protein
MSHSPRPRSRSQATIADLMVVVAFFGFGLAIRLDPLLIALLPVGILLLGLVWAALLSGAFPLRYLMSEAPRIGAEDETRLYPWLVADLDRRSVTERKIADHWSRIGPAVPRGVGDGGMNQGDRPNV